MESTSMKWLRFVHRRSSIARRCPRRFVNFRLDERPNGSIGARP